MDKFARFSDYEVFAYIASGLAALLVWDVAFSTHFLLNAEWKVADGVLVIASAYVLGQLLAAPSGWLLERQFVNHVLFRPSVNLMSIRPLGWRIVLKKSFLQDYYSPLDSRLRGKVTDRAARDAGRAVTGEEIFWCAFPIAKRDPTAYARMETFLKLYGFCRNLSFVALTGALIFLTDAAVGWRCHGWSVGVETQCWHALVATIVGLGMFHRYLKFFRLYSVEIFVAYSEA